jgi:hypothetical protein
LLSGVRQRSDLIGRSVILSTDIGPEDSGTTATEGRAGVASPELDDPRRSQAVIKQASIMA